MQRGIERPPGAEHAVGHAQQRSPHGAEDQHWRLAGGGQTLLERPAQAVRVVATIAGMYSAFRKRAWPTLESRGLPRTLLSDRVLVRVEPGKRHRLFGPLET